MAGAVHPLRPEMEAFMRAELSRVGPSGIDKAGIIKRYIDAGAPRARVYVWWKEVLQDWQDNPPPPESNPDQIPDPVEVARAFASLPTPAELKALDAAAAEAVQPKPLRDSGVPDSPRPIHGPDTPAAPRLDSETAKTAESARVESAAAIDLVPDSAKRILEQVQTIINTASGVITYSHTPDGKVRNPKMALASAETLRKCLETALRLYEAINNVALVERFMAEMLTEVGTLEPERAQAVIARMRGLNGRWSAT